MISVVIPVKNGGADLVRCLDVIAGQELDEELEVVVVDSGSTDGSVEEARGRGARVHEIPPEAFNHGSSRNTGVGLARGEIVVFTTQDAYGADRLWIATLVAPLQRERVAGVYGRQLPHAEARPPERFFLDFLYGPEPRSQLLGEGDELTFELTLFSNVNSAVRRELLLRFPFAEDLIMSEDQEWSRRILREGLEIVYEPRAAVHHSHAYTIASAFRRFFDSGASAERSYVDEARSSRSALRRAGLDYARGELEWLWSTGQRRWIPYTAVYEAAKFAGLQLGRRHRRLPPALKRRLSGIPDYWIDDASADATQARERDR